MKFLEARSIGLEFLIFGLLFHIVSISGRKRVKYENGIGNTNFVSIRYNDFKEREVRIAFKGILFLETSAFLNSSYEMKIRQITDGSKIVQSLFQGDTLKDCDYSENSNTILSFIQLFSSDAGVFQRKESGNVFTIYSDNQNLNSTYALQFFKHRKNLGPLRNFIKIRHEIKACHRMANRLKKDHHLHENTDNSSSAANNNANKDSTHHNTNAGIQSSSSTSDSRRHLHRSKRSFFTSLLMYPGTKWCGRGQTAIDYDDIGEDNELDVCCREHDVCPLIIEPFSTKFHYFNYRFHALLHCKCDEEFRWCLKQSLSPNAHFLGKIYFNIMGSKCFVLRQSKVCDQYSWWGTCLRYKNTATAFVKTQRYFKHLN